MPGDIRLTSKLFSRGCSALAIFCLFISADAHANLEAGKAKAQTICQTCHGMDGMAVQAMVPNLSGQPKDYLVMQMKAYRSGKRQHERMSLIAAMLTDEDIENLAEWFSSIKITLQLPL